MSMPKKVFDANCRACPRLAAFLATVKKRFPEYFCKPVPPFGDRQSDFLIVGLAPGLHGANRTGRPFTGDYAGILLYETLHKLGFASNAESVAADDGLQLVNCRITNAVKCLPPDNKPVGDEINTCNEFLARELDTLGSASVVLALGGIAHRAVLKAIGARQSDYRFAHAAIHEPGPFRLVDSYHCSRYNTNTGRLTPAMFEAVLARARALLND